ncbi:MAG: M23 family metallopeptidase [Crocinitomicaceae bacterium]
MEISKKIKQLITNSREKHKLSFTDDTTYRVKWSLRLSSFNLYTLIALYTLIIFIGLFFLIKYTSVRNLFVDAPPTASVFQINQNTKLIDSLSQQIQSRQKYLDDLKMILSKQSFSDSLSEGVNDSLYSNYQANFIKSRDDSTLRHKIESMSHLPEDITYDFFSAPVKGKVSRSFNPAKNHLGVDIVTQKDAPVKSCLEGTVIFSGWTPNEGEIVILQHNNDLISIYKHCQSVLKKVGDKVQTADPIAVVGNSGEHTSGPHLHFEIWKSGRVVDPQKLISFEN